MTPTAPATTAARSEISWVVQMRWGVAAAYALSLALAATGITQPMPLVPVVAAALLTVASNGAAWRWMDRPDTEDLAIGLLMFDATLLAVVLYFSGGASNPLSVLFLVQIALTALMFQRPWAWTLTALTIAAFGLLFFAPPAVDHSAHAHHVHHMAEAPGDGFDLHLRGMWLGFALSAVLVTYFVTSVSASLRLRERQLADARDRALRAERVASLAGLAAGTAHELGTPLSTILLAASEIERGLSGHVSDNERLRADAALIRDQAKRCRNILDAMIADSGGAPGEAPERSRADAIAREAIDSLPPHERQRVVLEATDAPDVNLPRRIVAQAIHNLLRNAFDASPPDATVTVTVTVGGGERGRVRYSVEDHGSGMDSELLQQAQEPFMTTKDGTARGMGLFIVTVIAERLGGECRLESTPGHGTTAVLEVSIDPVHA